MPRPAKYADAAARQAAYRARQNVTLLETELEEWATRLARAEASLLAAYEDSRPNLYAEAAPAQALVRYAEILHFYAKSHEQIRMQWATCERRWKAAVQLRDDISR